MKVKDLIERLQRTPMDSEVAIFDGENGSGSLRELNFGPVCGTATKDPDCDDIPAGTAVVVFGFGCY